MKKRHIRKKRKNLTRIFVYGVAGLVLILVLLAQFILSQNSFNPDDVTTWADAIINQNQRQSARAYILAELQDTEGSQEVNKQWKILNNEQRMKIWNAFKEAEFDVELRLLAIKLDGENAKLLTDAFDTDAKTKKQNIEHLSRLTSTDIPEGTSDDKKKEAHKIDEETKDKFMKAFKNKGDDSGLSIFLSDRQQRKNNIKTELSINTKNIADIKYDILDDGSEKVVITDKDGNKRIIPITGLNSGEGYFTNIIYDNGRVFYVRDDNHRYVIETEGFLQYRDNQWVLVEKINGEEYVTAIDLGNKEKGMVQVTRDKDGVLRIDKWGGANIKPDSQTELISSGKNKDDYGYVRVKSQNSFEVSGFKEVVSTSENLKVKSLDEEGFTFKYKDKEGKEKTVEGLEFVVKRGEKINSLRTDEVTLRDENGIIVGNGQGLMSDDVKMVVEEAQKKRPFSIKRIQEGYAAVFPNGIKLVKDKIGNEEIEFYGLVSSKDPNGHSLMVFNPENLGQNKGEPELIVKFGASWCGPCKVQESIIKTEYKKTPKISYISIDVELHPDLAKKYGYPGLPIPRMIAFKGNTPVPNSMVTGLQQDIIGYSKNSFRGK